MYNKFNQKTQLSIKLGSHFLTTPPQKKKKNKSDLIQLEPWLSNHQDPLSSPGFKKCHV